MARDDCHRCEGKGWYWRVPSGFNPFRAGGFNTARIATPEKVIYKLTRLSERLSELKQNNT